MSYTTDVGAGGGGEWEVIYDGAPDLVPNHDFQSGEIYRVTIRTLFPPADYALSAVQGALDRFGISAQIYGNGNSIVIVWRA